MTSWLVRSTPERAVRVRALTEYIMLCSWARHFTVTVKIMVQRTANENAACYERSAKDLITGV